MTKQLTRLLGTMATLRDPERGCEWDRAQRFETIVPHTIEEAYEVADAVARGDMRDIREELGDLLFQVVFQARIAEEAGHFDFDDVARSIAEKLEARHPHIFGDADMPGGMREERWEALKAQERAAKGAESALDGVAAALPALMRAEKLQKRAARAGFDWPDPEGPRAKVVEEMAEDCGISISTVYEAMNRLTNLLLVHRDGVFYQVNPRFFFAQHPEVAQLALEALQAPDIVPDERAHQPRRASPATVRRRRVVRSAG